MSDIWEPWQPQLGDRVRVRLSAECDHRSDDVDVATGIRKKRDYVGHPAASDGIVGVIAFIDHPTFTEPADGHRYGVKFDRPIWVNGPLIGMACAAAELVPVDV